jgi:hypothetical protein
MTKLRITLALTVSALAGAAIAAVAAPPAPTGSDGAAKALVSAGLPGGANVNPAGARARAGEAGVPLPAGGTFNGIQFENGGEQITPRELQGVLEYNAACQWLRAWRDGRDAARALRVLQTVSQWPSLRGTESGEFVGTVAAEAAAGGGSTARAMLTGCDASHAREIEYANRLGLTPSR